MDFRISDYQGTIYLIIYIDPPNCGVDTKITTLIWKILIYSHSKAMATICILDSIVKITPLQISDFLRFSVHYIWCHIQPITVVTYDVAILSKILMHFGAILPVWWPF